MLKNDRRWLHVKENILRPLHSRKKLTALKHFCKCFAKMFYCIGLPIHCNYQLAHYSGFVEYLRFTCNQGLTDQAGDCCAYGVVYRDCSVTHIARSDQPSSYFQTNETLCVSCTGEDAAKQCDIDGLQLGRDALIIRHGVRLCRRCLCPVRSLQRQIDETTGWQLGPSAGASSRQHPAEIGHEARWDHHFAVQVITSTKGTIWTRKAPACLLTVVYAYGKPRLPPVHKYSLLHNAPCSKPLRYTHCAGPAGQCSNEGSMSSFKSITWKELW